MAALCAMCGEPFLVDDCESILWQDHLCPDCLQYVRDILFFIPIEEEETCRENGKTDAS